MAYKAVETVFFSLTQEQGREIFFGHKAVERELLIIDNLAAAALELGLSAQDLLTKLRAYVDRFGTYKVPFGVPVELARHCCRRRLREVLSYVSRS